MKKIVLNSIAIAIVAITILAMSRSVLLLDTTQIDDIASLRIDLLFAAVAKDNFASTYDSLTSPELRESTSRKDYEAYGLALQKCGKLVQKAMDGYRIRQSRHGTLDVSYLVNFENGQGVFVGRLTELNGEWKFDSFSIQSWSGYPNSIDG